MKSSRLHPVRRLVVCGGAWLLALRAAVADQPSPLTGTASWYGEEHRGNLMANGHKFDPDKITAASWFYPLGTRVRVTVNSPSFEKRSVLVTVTDRGPRKHLVRDSRIVDLAHAAFAELASPDLGLIAVSVEPAR